MRGHYFEDKATIARKVQETQQVQTAKPVDRDTLASLVAFAAHQALQKDLELNSTGCFRSLDGLTREQIDAAIREALA